MLDGYSFINRWRTKVLEFPSLFSSGYALFHFPYPLSPLLANLTKTAGCIPTIPNLELVTRHLSLAALLKFSIFTFLRTLLYASKCQRLCFQAFPHSLCKTWGVGVLFSASGGGCGPREAQRRASFASPDLSGRGASQILSCRFLCPVPRSVASARSSGRRFSRPGAVGASAVTTSEPGLRRGPAPFPPGCARAPNRRCRPRLSLAR